MEIKGAPLKNGLLNFPWNPVHTLHLFDVESFDVNLFMHRDIWEGCQCEERISDMLFHKYAIKLYNAFYTMSKISPDHLYIIGQFINVSLLNLKIFTALNII